MRPEEDPGWNLAQWNARIPKNCPKHAQNCSVRRPCDGLVPSRADCSDNSFKAHHVPCGTTIGMVVIFVQMTDGPSTTFKTCITRYPPAPYYRCMLGTMVLPKSITNFARIVTFHAKGEAGYRPSHAVGVGASCHPPINDKSTKRSPGVCPR